VMLTLPLLYRVQGRNERYSPLDYYSVELLWKIIGSKTGQVDSA